MMTKYIITVILDFHTITLLNAKLDTENDSNVYNIVVH